jgi:hypothetical protein
MDIPLGASVAHWLVSRYTLLLSFSSFVESKDYRMFFAHSRNLLLDSKRVVSGGLDSDVYVWNTENVSKVCFYMYLSRRFAEILPFCFFLFSFSRSVFVLLKLILLVSPMYCLLITILLRRLVTMQPLVLGRFPINSCTISKCGVFSADSLTFKNSCIVDFKTQMD